MNFKTAAEIQHEEWTAQQKALILEHGYCSRCVRHNRDPPLAGPLCNVCMEEMAIHQWKVNSKK